MKTKTNQRGFTLIELMITVAVVGILAAIAYPSYREYVSKSRRAEAKTILLSAQQWMERFYSENYRYDKNSAGVAVTDASQFPAYFSVSPVPGQGSPVYDVSVVVTDGVRDTYSLKAVRRSGSVMASDKCGDYYLDQYQRRDLKNYSTSAFASKSAAMDYCWR
ncbi:prepilin-type cleavage/methylation domain-containing protein [Paracidovorax avenae]|uniref:type IV pilin protein n=1 Tax=Paracidovorax avenae TaxID=80867 RepID=UPI000D153EA9|nr:type IV pilin protein [Paracidovorax avenae]AVS78597.1 prepilin-type cleavage/methylation domain-containing protein [Paracidovorax avenae]AVS82124.1 prepilin-type cleavage/methylation domain-containing protein [Paracidovorax avenae]AVT17301.1 prepilin-type cleavage/methylation domain-containing protein [Paracidovorax avenae]